MAIILDGKRLSQEVLKDVKERVYRFKEKNGYAPQLAVILVGENPASQVYVRNKKKSSEEVGINSEIYHLPSSTKEEELKELISKLNNEKSIHGILLQLPLPPHLDGTKFINMINPLKDVDGFHVENMGLLSAGNPRYIPCTPYGILKLCNAYGIEIKGANVTIIGRSNIVGRPLASLMLLHDATVTVCHSKTKNIIEHTKKADILVCATGKAKMVKKDWVKEGSCVIDVGISRNEEGKLTGDVDFEEVKDIAGYITPVPGGVGPMTVAMLMENTLKAAEIQAQM